jgi:hypothetical protein
MMLQALCRGVDLERCSGTPGMEFRFNCEQESAIGDYVNMAAPR